MRPEASAFLGKAREFLLKAEDMFADGWPDEAGRAAYLAGLHAAQAVIVERTGRIIKRHRGVRNELRRLLKDEPRFDFELSAFLARAYNLKAIADYETGPDAQVSAEFARGTIEAAPDFPQRHPEEYLRMPVVTADEARAIAKEAFI